MTWGPLGNQKAASSRPIPDFLGSDQDVRGQVYPPHGRGEYPSRPAKNVGPHSASEYDGYRQSLITLSLTKKSVFFLFVTFMLCVTFAFIIGFATSFMMFSQNNQSDTTPQKSTRVLSKKPDIAKLASDKKKIIIQQEENDLDDEELE